MSPPWVPDIKNTLFKFYNHPSVGIIITICLIDG